MKLGVAIAVLLVGFDGDEAGRLGRETVMDGPLDVVFFSSSAEGKAELSAGERRRSSIGTDGLDEAAGRSLSASSGRGLGCAACSFKPASACGIGIVDRID
jgi:hypothetical protein